MDIRAVMDIRVVANIRAVMDIKDVMDIRAVEGIKAVVYVEKTYHIIHMSPLNSGGFRSVKHRILRPFFGVGFHLYNGLSIYKIFHIQI